MALLKSSSRTTAEAIEKEIDRLKSLETWWKGKLYRNHSYYGRSKILRELTGLPPLFPINVGMNHGIIFYTLTQNYADQVARMRSPVFFAHSSRIASFLRDKINKRVEIFADVFPQYRRFKGWKRLTETEGTLYYPHHSTREVTVTNDIKGICDRLAALPDEYHPITISLYFRDLLNGNWQTYQDYGFDVVCNGHFYDQNFVDNFYHNLLSHRFAAGNGLGSHTFYAIEASIPYFILGAPPVNITAKVDDGVYKKGDQSTTVFHAEERQIHFEEKLTYQSLPWLPRLDDETTAYVQAELGTYDSVSTKRMRRELIKALPLTFSKLFRVVSDDIKNKFS